MNPNRSRFGVQRSGLSVPGTSLILMQPPEANEPLNGYQPVIITYLRFQYQFIIEV
jgi:hypothetical protein